MTTRFDFSRRRLPVWTVMLLVAVAGRVVAEDAVTIGPDHSSADGSSAASATPPSGGKRYDLRYKIATGDVLRYDVKHRASIRSTIDDTTQAAQTKTDSIKVWKVTDVLPNGEIEFTNVVERVAMVNQLPDRDAVEYDSARDTTPPPGFEDAAKAIGVPLSVVRMTPRGEIVRRDIKLRHLNAEDDAPIVLRLPDNPVAIGDTWDQPFDIRVQAQGGVTKPIKTRRHHKLIAVDNNMATIEVAYQILSPVDSTTESQLIERLMSGEVQFDLATGRIVGQQMEVDKRILGFAGPTSSMQYIMRMDEKLLAPQTTAAAKKRGESESKETRVATNPPRGVESEKQKTTAATGNKQSGTTTTKNSPGNTRRQPRTSRTANRNTTPVGSKGYRR